MTIHSQVMARTARLQSLPNADLDKRSKILDAATRVFAERGFFGAQVADIARRAGIASGTVYLYFRSKDDVLRSLFDRTMQKALEDDCTGMMWQVLDWNEPAINFYKKYNAAFDSEWVNCSLFV